MTRLPARSSDDGAVAVLVAILSLVLFGSAAVAVDLGKAFQVRRATQTTADLAALAGAQDLPNALAACRSAVRYLRDNPPDGDGFTITELMCNAAGSTPDGSIDVSSSRTRITVSVPRRTVEFGFAGALGFAGTTVGAEAVAEIRSPTPSIPYFLSADTSSGLICLKDTTSGGAIPPAASAMRAALLAAPPAKTPSVSSVEPAPFEGPAGTIVTIKGTNLDVIVRLRFGPNDAVFSVSGNGKTLTATVPPGSGTVTVIGYTQADLSGTAYSMPEPFVYTTVAPPPPPPPVVDDCAGSTGQFGYLDIPRADGNSGEQVELNIIKGVDHAIGAFPTAQLPPIGSTCANASGGAPIPGAVPDVGSGVSGANCLRTQSGNALPNTTRGFLDGVAGLDGRLEGHSPTGTVATRGNINIDTFGSFLRGGVTTAAFTGPGAPATIAALPVGTLDRSILDSPRFAVVPVLNIAGAGTSHGYYPVLTLHGVFVDSAPSAPAHGFVTSGGGSQVTAVHAYAFPLSLLPGLLSTSEVDGTVSYIGFGPVIPVLVE